MAPVILLIVFCFTLLLCLYNFSKQRPPNFPPGTSVLRKGSSEIEGTVDINKIFLFFRGEFKCGL
jgi:hypothetical protein